MLKVEDVNVYLEQIKAGTIKSKDAATALGITTRHLNRFTKAAGVSRPEGARKGKEAKTILRNALIKGCAEAYLKGVLSKKRAADMAEVSMRTIERWADKLSAEKVEG